MALRSLSEYCDRALILDNGKVMAQGTPVELRTLVPLAPGQSLLTVTMEDAFMAVVEKARDHEMPHHA